MEENKEFLNQDNNYRTLMAFQKAECIYDVTYYFAHKFLKTGDRTIDQMVQAARSGKQNIAEGNIDGVTSREMELKLTNVNRASLHELLLDYEDYLRVRGLEQWKYDDPRCIKTREFCKKYLNSAIYREKILSRSDEAIANIAKEHLAEDGMLVVEINESLADKTCELFHKQGFSPEVYTDFRGKSRWISAVWNP
jgi:hypothetical protein